MQNLPTDNILLESFTSLGMSCIENSGPYYEDDATIIIQVGNQVVRHSLDASECTYLLTGKDLAISSRNIEVTAFSVSNDGRFLGIAFKKEKDSSILYIYSLPHKTPYMRISSENALSLPFVTFHSTHKIGACLLNEIRKQYLLLFNLNTRQEIKRCLLPANFSTIQFNPKTMNLILFSPKYIAHYQYQTNSVTQINIPNYSNFSGFVYSKNEEDISILSSGRDLLFLSNFTLKHTITIPLQSSICHLSSFAHGLLAFLENSSIILIQHNPGVKEISQIFKIGPTVKYNIPFPVIWTTFSPSGHQVLCNVDHRELILLNVREFESNNDNIIIYPNIISHKGPVGSISVCANNPLLASCGSEDKTVIVWDYSKQQSILHLVFSEQLTDVTFHPSGDLLAAASTEKLYLYSVTVESLVLRTSWPLFNCLSIQFSNGGHFLVAASHIITFINPYTHEILATLRNHSGLINCISFSPDDKRLVSCGSDGIINEWNAVKQSNDWSQTIPKHDFSSAVITDRGTIIACNKDHTLHHCYTNMHQIRLSESGFSFSSLLFVSPSCLIAGDTYGGISIIPFPFLLPVQYQSEYEGLMQLEFCDPRDVKRSENKKIPFSLGQTYETHCGEIRKMCVSLDGKVFFSCSSDSSICVFNVLSSNQSYNPSSTPILRCEIPHQQFFLVLSSRFEELEHQAEKLKKEIHSQAEHFKHETLLSISAHQKNITELIASQTEKKQALDNQIKEYNESMNESTIKAAIIFQNMEAAHLKEAKALTNLYEQKLDIERQKCETVQKEVEDMKCSYEERIYLLKQQYKDSLKELSSKIENEQNSLDMSFNSTKSKIEISEKKHEQEAVDLELQFERDRMEIQLQYITKIRSLQQQKKELDEKCQKLSIATQQQDEILARLRTNLNDAKVEKEALDKILQAQAHQEECKKSELKDRDETLLRQAERLEQLQRSNAELENFKGMMNFRLKEMEKELQPQQDKIIKYSSELDGNSEEIRSIQRSTKANKRTMKDKLHQIEVLKHKLQLQNSSLNKKKKIIKMFRNDLIDGIKIRQVDPSILLKDLYDKYVVKQNLEQSLKDTTETIDANTRTRRHLQQSVMLLQRQSQQQQQISQKHWSAKSNENSTLLIDYNELMKENKQLRKRLDLINSDIEMMETNLKKAQQQSQEQSFKRKRMAQTALGIRKKKIVGEWVSQKAQNTGAHSNVKVVDSRGRYLHSSGKM